LISKKNIVTTGQKSSNHDEIKHSNKINIKIDSHQESQQKIKKPFFNPSATLPKDEVY
jgi:ATP adenylyltransferase/5',5'''-P-1,P-4-tetraphosphate phosphorylase II